MEKPASTVMDVMRAIAACGLDPHDVTAVFVERDRDRHFTVALAMDPSKQRRAALERGLKSAGLEVERWKVELDEDDDGYRVDVTLRQPFGEWPLVDVYDLFLRTFRQRTGTRVEPILGGYSDPQPETFRLLDSIEVVRLRPTNYVGSVESSLPLLEKTLQVMVARHLEHPSSRVTLTLGKDGKCTVADDAPGATLFDLEGRDPETLYGMWNTDGLVVVKALSEWMTVESCRGGVTEALAYRRGRIEPFKAGAFSGHGNRVTFEPDLDLLSAPLQKKESRELCEWAAMLVPKLELTFNGERFCFESFAPAVRRIAKRPLWSDQVFQFAFKTAVPELEVECALGWREGPTEVQSFVNYQRVPDDSSLERGLRTALQQAISLGREQARVSDPLGRVAAVILARVPAPELGLRGAYVNAVVEETIAQQLADPLSVFLDSVEGAREKLHQPEAPTVKKKRNRK